MSLEFFTGADGEHIEQLNLSLKTHWKHHPEMFDYLWTVFYDPSQVTNRQVLSLNIPMCRPIAWRFEAETQRARMLACFIHGIAQWSSQTWYAKIDADTVSVSGGNWRNDSWLEGDPAWVGQRWGYTRPHTMLDQLDAWADTVEELKHLPPPPREIRGEVARHKRLISWFMLGNAAWLQKIVSWMDGKMPCGSQDTILSYCSSRLGSPVRYVDMKRAGFNHCGNGGERLKRAAEEALR